MARAGTQGTQGAAIFPGWHLVSPLELARRAYGALMTWQARITDRSHLEGLDERLLKDMGLNATDVRHEAAKPFWRA